MSGVKITCPYCGHVADEEDFDMSLVGECFCPACHRAFMAEDEEDEDDEVEDAS